MDNVLVKALPPMLTGSALDEALPILPEYDPNITTQDAATRLVALNDLYKVFVPTKMAKEMICVNVNEKVCYRAHEYLSHPVIGCSA
jgi:hypothetical protein